MNKQKLKSQINQYLSGEKEVLFAYVFGSFIRDAAYRDIDIAVYMKPFPDLVRLGRMQAELSGLTGKETDLVLLNKLPNKNPSFAHNIVSRGELLLNRNPKQHTGYKHRVLLMYFDTAPLREKVDRAFEKRVESGKFGQRNYE